MDLHNLKKLRGVCKLTKATVEQPKYLQKFKITLQDLESQMIVLGSTVPWNNFVLDSFFDPVLPEFLTKFGKSIQHFEIQNGLISDLPIILSSLSSTLGFKIQTLIIEAILINPHDFQTPIWANNFTELKRLKIDGIMSFPDAPKTLFEIILDNCTLKLMYLTIPGYVLSITKTLGTRTWVNYYCD